MQILKSIQQLLFISLLVFVYTTAHGSEISAFGPEQYLRTTSAPNIYSESFESYPGEALLIIYNGEPGEKSNNDNRVTSGKITLNGEVLFTHDDFKHQTYTLEIPITLLENNSLRIELESKPGTYLSLEIFQTIPDPVYDLVALELEVNAENCPDSVDISLTMTNLGEDAIPEGVQVAFYNGHPDEGGTLIDIVTSSTVLAPSGVEGIALQWENPAVEEATIYARVDDDGSGRGAYEEEDETNNLISIEAALCHVVSGDSSISGHVIDAVNGDLLIGVKTLLHVDNNGAPGAVIASVESNDAGIFFYPDLAAGSYFISASHPGYINSKRPVILNAGTQLTNQDIVLSPVLDEGEFRIVLTWKNKPADLESHLTEPNPEGCRYHCYYFNKTTPTASLDLDDRNGYGPETITVSTMEHGTYRYYVHDFTNRSNQYSRGLQYSGAKVTVYSGSNEPVVFNVPATYGNVWHVFDLDGETGEIIPVHKMTAQSEPGRIDYPRIVSGTPNRYAYWGSTWRYQTGAIDPDDDTLTYSLQNAPEGMTIDPDSGLIQWTPYGNQMGWYYNIIIKVEDGRCGEVTKGFRVYVNSLPIVNFSVSPCSGFNPGGDITLTWSTSRASTVLIDQGIGVVDASGSITLPSPEVPIAYTLTAFNDAALVKKVVPKPPGASFYFSPRNITIGQSTRLYWNSPCSTSRSIDHGIGEVAVSGSVEVTPSRSAYYYLNAKNGGGSRKHWAYVNVYIPPDYFEISPLCNFNAGAPMTLSWHINNATDVHISPGVGGVEPTGTYTVYPTEPGSYTLTATVNGNTVTRSVSFPNLPTVGTSPTYRYLDLGQSMTFRYWSGCADTVTINHGIGEVNPGGYMTVTPDYLPKTYTVTSTNERGSRSAYVRLRQILPAVSLSPYSSYGMDLGNSVTLKWSTNYADTVTMNQGAGEIDFSGSLTVTPESLPMTYTVTGRNSAGAVSRSVRLYQIKPAGSLKADPAILKVGNSSTLTWTSSRADSCSISPDVGPVACNGSTTVTPTKPGYYTLTLVGPGGTLRRSVYLSFVAPVADLKAEPLTIKEGESAHLTWIFANATSCVIDQAIGGVELGGERFVSPAATTTYTMTATGPGGTKRDSVKITVIPANPLPGVSLSLSDRIIMRGASTNLSWESSFTDSVLFDQGIGIVGLSGSESLSPEVTTTYTATATGPGGISTATITVTVMQPPPTLTLTGDPVTVMAGDSAVLSWNSADANTISLNQGIGDVSLDGSLTVSPNAATTYVATATGPGGKTTRSVTITVTYPLPTVSFSATPSSVKAGESIVLAWSAANAESVSIDQGIGMVDPSGTLQVSPAEDTVYSITVSGPGGIVTEQAAVTVIPSPITLTITSPADNATLARPDVMVTGTVIHVGRLETGVVVNGVVALVYNGEFVANHVPLTVGENTITVKAIDVNGEYVEENISVAVENFSRKIELNADMESGLAPVESMLTFSTNFIVSAQPVISCSGPAAVEVLTGVEPDTWDISMTESGIYVCTAEMQDENGVNYSDQVAILAMNRSVLDALLQSKWNGMKVAMMAGNIEGAVQEFTFGQQQIFREIFTITGDKLAQMALDMQDIELIYQKNDTSEYRIRRDVIFKGSPETITFYIYFQRGADGIWRIRDF